MTEVTLLEVDALRLADGVAETLLLAGGGSRPYYGHRGKAAWRAAIQNPPRFSWAVGFDETGWTGTTLPPTARIALLSGTAMLMSQYAETYLWPGSKARLYTGDDRNADPGFVLDMAGTVSSLAFEANGIAIEVADQSEALNKPVITARFSGGGGIDGDAEAAERVKRRSLGRVFNVRGNVLAKAFNIYEFGDPARPLQSFLGVKDIGRFGTITVLAWQGSIAATFTALKAAVAPQGGGVVAPSIACVKWWTTPILLTADIEGEVGAAYTATAPELADRIITAGGLTTSNAAASAAAHPATVGLHIDTDSETFANALDRLLLPLFILWLPSEAGIVELVDFTLSDPVATFTAEEVSRQSVFKPTTARRVGYQRNHYVHSDAEISAAVTYADGTSIDDLRPATSNADNTAATPTAEAVGNGLNQNGSVKDGKVDTDAIVKGAVQQTLPVILTSDVSVPRGTIVQVAQSTFDVTDADSLIKVTFSGMFWSPDDLSFNCSVVVDNSVSYSAGTVDMTFDQRASNAKATISPFTYINLGVGSHTVGFNVQNVEDENLTLAVKAGSALEVLIIKKGAQ